MTEAIIEFFRNFIGNDYVTTVIIAFIPIIELRGAIPVAIEMGMEWWQAFGLSYLGSCLAIPILLLTLRPILNLLKRIKFFNRFATTIEDMFADKAAKIAAKAGGEGDTNRKELLIKLIGVFTFVALPIPLTGVWTGSAIAVFLGLPFFKSLAVIMIGNFTAGTIMTLLSVFLKPYLDIILSVFFILVIVIVVFYIVMITFKMIKSKKADKLAASGNMQVHDIAIDNGCSADGQDNSNNAVASSDSVAGECSSIVDRDKGDSATEDRRSDNTRDTVKSADSSTDKSGRDNAKKADSTSDK